MRRVARLVALAAIALATVLPAAPALAAKTGVVTGSAPKAPAGKLFKPSVTAYRLTPTYDESFVRVRSNGAFRFVGAPGLYAVVVNGWLSGRPRSKVRIVRVRAGKASPLPAFRTAGGTSPPPVRVGIGQMKVTVPNVDPFFGKGFHDMVASEFAVTPPAGCTIAAVEDRKYGRFNDVLRELALWNSRYASPGTRADYVKAVKTLKQWSPTHRVNGTIDTITANSASGTFRLVNLATGKVEWEQRLESTGGSAAFTLSDVVAAALFKRLCEYPPRLQVDVTGTFTGANSEASGTLAATLSYVATARPGEPGNYDRPASNWTPGVATLTDAGDDCAETGGTGRQVIPETAGTGAVIRDGSVTVFLFPLLTVDHQRLDRTPMEPLCLEGPASLPISVGATPGITAVGPLSAPIRVTGAANGGTYDVTVTVTPLQG